MVDKLYIIIRADLRPGQQAVQAAHAMRQFVADHPDIDRKWFEQSNTLAFLSVPDEWTLRKLADKADDQDLRLSSFREPDLDNAMTALALEPGLVSRRLCRNLPLAFGG